MLLNFQTAPEQGRTISSSGRGKEITLTYLKLSASTDFDTPSWTSNGMNTCEHDSKLIFWLRWCMSRRASISSAFLKWFWWHSGILQSILSEANHNQLYLEYRHDNHCKIWSHLKSNHVLLLLWRPWACFGLFRQQGPARGAPGGQQGGTWRPISA